MAIYKGNKKVVAVYKGSTPVNKIYKGVTLVFQTGGGSQSNTVVIKFTDDSDPANRKYEPVCEGTTKTATSQTIELPSEGETYKFGEPDNKKTLLEIRNYSNNCPSVTSFSMLFFAATNMTTLTFAQGMDTSKIETMEYMFNYCWSLVSLDLSSFNTSNCTSFMYMFAECKSLVSLDLSSFNTSNCISFDGMFAECSSLVSLDLSNFDTSSAGFIQGIFSGCGKLTHIKCKQAFKDWCISNQYEIALPTAMREGGSGTWEIIEGGSTRLFEGTSTGTFGLKINGNDPRIPITPDADGKWFYGTDEKITSLVNALYDQEAVTSVDLSYFDLTDISTNKMFYSCSNITSIKFNKTKSMKLRDVDSMFYGCSRLVSLDLSSFKTSNLTSAAYMFYGCSRLVSLDLSSFNTSNLTSAAYMFSDCSSLVSLDLSNFDTSNLTSAFFMFYGCSSLVSLDLSNWNTSNFTDVSQMFSGCSSLVSLDLSNFDMSKATSYNNMFKNCSSLSTIKCKQAFKDWCITHQDDIYLPTAMREGGTGTWEIIDGGSTHLFEGTATGNFNLKINNNQTIPITPDADGKWFYDTDEKITSLNSAFYIATDVTSVDLSNLDLTDISTNSMFRASSNITSIKFNNTKSMKLVDVKSMFLGCRLLVSLDLSNWNTSNLTSASSLFSGCSSLVSLDLSSFDTSQLTSANTLFSNCSSLVSLDLSNFDMSKATSYNNMFENCTSLSTIKCKQAFKDWCIRNKYKIKLPTAMREGGTGTWEIVG